MKAEKEVSKEGIDMKRVGEIGVDYTVPTGTDDRGRATVTGGYLMATTQTTYALWYEVKVWAEANEYNFQNQGEEGSHGATGQPPTSASQAPVTNVSWYDTIVWLNALSDMHGLNPVYRDASNQVIRDSRRYNVRLLGTVQTKNNGYRLPTSDEWEMAARWKHDTENTDGSILVGGRYWTPGNYASGATDDYHNEAATRAVAWYAGAPGGDFTRPVGQLIPNHLGLYDMSGNVWEWTYTKNWSKRVLRGGWFIDADSMRLGSSDSFYSFDVSSDFGFRFVRNP